MTVLMLFVVAMAQLRAAVPPIVLTSPDDYQVISVSPNGKWATGVYVDYGGSIFGFLWNLESNSTKLLSTTLPSYGNSVSNDGVVVGHFTYIPPTGGSPREVPGYYKDGAWHVVEFPDGVGVGDMGSSGQGGGITPDGSRMTGVLYLNKSYTPFVWDLANGGKIIKQLDISNPEGTTMHGIASCISPNGMMAGGWAQRYNRSNVIWDVTTGQKKYVGMTDHAHQGFNAAVVKFSPDGKKVIFGGGWDMKVPASSATQWAFSVYDLETGDITEFPTIGGNNATVSLFGISSDYTVVGSNSDFDSGRGVIYKAATAEYDETTGYYKAAQPQYLDAYLAAQGVNFAKLGMYYNPYTTTKTTTVFRGQDISADGNVICALYYGSVGGLAVLRSMIVKLNQDQTHAAPQEMSLNKMAGINTVQITWKHPVVATEGIKSYAVYRDGVKIQTLAKNITRYYDRNVELGTHRYYVASVYDDMEMNSTEFSINVQPEVIQPIQNLFARQRGVNSLFAQWDAPLSNLINKNWYNPATANIMDFGIGIGDVDIEMGIGFSKDEIELYEGCMLKKVAFYPIEKRNFTLNIYTYNALGRLQLAYTQPVTQELVLKERNTVELTKPFEVPTGSKVVVAFATHMREGGAVLGMDYGRSTAGYSDLIRFADESDFYSYEELTTQQGYPNFMSLMIDMILEPSGSATSVDEVAYYEVALSGKTVGTTTERSYIIPDAIVTSSAANRTVGVKAVYADGSVSNSVASTIRMEPHFIGVDEVKSEQVSGSALKVSWDAPLDVDAFDVSYTGTLPGVDRKSGVKGPASNNYGYMAGALYTPAMVKGYDGYKIKSFSFYPIGDATFTFMLLEDGVQVCEVPVYDYTLNAWNEVELDKVITVKEKCSYTLVLDVYDAEPGVSVLAIDNTAPFVGSGDVYSLDLGPEFASWNSVSQNGVRGNWMMRMKIEEPEPQPARITGYDVYISKPGTTNVAKVNSSAVTDTEYVHDFGEVADGKGLIRVASYYSGRAVVAAPGTSCEYTMSNEGFDGIDEVVSATESSAVYHDLMGRRVVKPSRGLYINNGKKITLTK